jgi:hypothetical protein
MNNSANRDNEISGNTNRNHHKKQDSNVKKWCFTLNNYTKEEYSYIVLQFDTLALKYIIGKEVGECGTPHLQGYVNFHKKARLTALKKLNTRLHWEKARDEANSIIYCAKDNDYILKGIKMYELRKVEPYNGEDLPTKDELYEWQNVLLDILNKPADSRAIFWYWENVGCVGKTMFAKYLGFHHNALICQKGKYSDIMNMAFNHPKLEIMIIDVPRSSGNSVSYNAIETIKSGIIVNTKYETGQKFIKIPHIIIFANFPPDESQLSEDRWNIVNIERKFNENKKREC